MKLDDGSISGDASAGARAAAGLTELEEYLFDLNGYLILKGAVSAEDIDALNASYDQMAAAEIEGKGWFGNVAVDNSGGQEGLIFHQLYEAGPVWESLI